MPTEITMKWDEYEELIRLLQESQYDIDDTLKKIEHIEPDIHDTLCYRSDRITALMRKHRRD